MELITLFLAAPIILIVYLWYRRPDPRLPPSPMRPLPLLGHLLYMSHDLRPQIKEWRKRCGDIFSLNIAGTQVVVLNGYDLIKEALVKKGDVFSDRPVYIFDEAMGTQNCGIVFSNGDNWKEQRSVALSILKELGMGKNLLAEKIQEEIGCYIKYLASLKGKPTDISSMTNICTCNVVCSILIGHRFEYDDHEFKNLMSKLDYLSIELQNVSIIVLLPWLRYIPGDFFKAKRLISNMAAVMDLLKKFIEERRSHMEDYIDVGTFIDAYFVERNKKVQAGLPTLLDDRNLLKSMFDLFAGGTGTTSTTINWCILYMLNYPEVQEKVYQEIREKVGTARTPTIQDRSQLTYLNAVILETQRLASIGPLALAHLLRQEVTLRGYTIPKGTHILPNLDSVLHDKATWGDDAMSFRPERFIDDNGKLNIPEQFIPFSVGPRGCPGESMARMELFLFLSSIFQRFQLLPPTQGSVPPLKYMCGVVMHPAMYQLRALERA